MRDYKLEKMGRRQFTKVASALGISAASLRLGTQDGLVSAMDDPSKEVSYVAEMEVERNEDGIPIGRKPIYRSIPRSEWVDVETTTNALKRITKKK